MNLLKIILSTSAFAIASVALHAQLPTKVESFPVRDVRLTASPFKHAEDMDIPVICWEWTPIVCWLLI